MSERTRAFCPAAAVVLAAVSVGAAAATQEGLTPRQTELVRVAAWGSDDESAAALQTLREELEPSGAAVSREVFLNLEEILRQGAPIERARPPATGGNAESFEVALPDGRRIPVLAVLPPGYDAAYRWPVMFAMHGGPPGSAQVAIQGAGRMLAVWREAAAQAGWIVVAPAMTHVRSMGQRTETRLPYEILRPDQVSVILSVVQRRFRVDPDRIVSTGISLGSNFSIGYAASIPDRFAAIVPVSTEGDSRERLLRNLQHVPTYVLEGSQDRNIRGINGPRPWATSWRASPTMPPIENSVTAPMRDSRSCIRTCSAGPPRAHATPTQTSFCGCRTPASCRWRDAPSGSSRTLGRGSFRRASRVTTRSTSTCAGRAN